MKVRNTKAINEKIMEYALNTYISYSLGMGLNTPVSMGLINFDDYNGIENASRLYIDKYGLVYDEGIMAAMITSVLSGYNQLNNIPAEIMLDIVHQSRIFHKGDFDNNPYLKNVHFDNQKYDEFKLTNKKFEKYELFMWDEPYKNKLGINIPRIGCFDYEFSFPCILEGKDAWMSITPSELYSMQKSIDEASGKVLTLGCGLGAYAFLTAEKENVESVTIVEISDKVIELFNKYILPNFTNKEKIHIVKADAYEYLKYLEDGMFDYCFADTWIGNLSLIPYIKTKKLCKRFSKMKVAYWIENSIVETMMTLVNGEIMKEYYKNNNIPHQEPTIADNFSKDEMESYKFVNELLQNEEISRPEHIDYYMNSKNIIDLALKEKEKM